MSCKFECNYECSCFTPSILLRINNKCNLACFNCTQSHSTTNTYLLKYIFEYVVKYCTKTLTIMGGEFSLLTKEEQEFIFNVLIKYNKTHVICTNNMDIEFPGIKFNRHITDFNTIPKVGEDYSIVALDSQLTTIYDYIHFYSNIRFYLFYDRIQKTDYVNKETLFRILQLPNIKMQGYGIIKKLLNKPNMHSFICKLLNTSCSCSLELQCYLEEGCHVNSDVILNADVIKNL